MDAGQLAQAVVDSVAKHFTGRAGQAGAAAAEQLYRVLARQLGQTPWGRRVLDGLRNEPGDPERRQLAVEAVTAEVRRDRRFGAELDRVVHFSGVLMQGHDVRYRSDVRHVDSSGDQRDIRISGDHNRVKLKKYHIGSVHFGTGGLVSGAAALVAVLGGGTTAIVAAQDPPVRLEQAVGKWTKPGETLNGIKVDPYVLAVVAGGGFDFTFGAAISIPGMPSGGVPGVSTHFHCVGTVTADKDHFTLRAGSGGCSDISATLSGDGARLQVVVGSDGQAVSLDKTA